MIHQNRLRQKRQQFHHPDKSLADPALGTAGAAGEREGGEERAQPSQREMMFQRQSSLLTDVDVSLRTVYKCLCFCSWHCV